MVSSIAGSRKKWMRAVCSTWRTRRSSGTCMTTSTRVWPRSTAATWRFDSGFLDDIYRSGETLSDPTTTIGQLIAGDIYGNQIWGDPGIGGSISVPTPVPFISAGMGFEVIYDWGNDGRPGTGLHTYGYFQWGPSLGAPGSINLQQTYNFRPEGYTGRFDHIGGSIPLPKIGGGYLGISRTPDGWDAIETGLPDTNPYTYYGGWAAGGSIQYQRQYYVWLTVTDTQTILIPHAN